MKIFTPAIKLNENFSSGRVFILKKRINRKGGENSNASIAFDFSN